MPSTVVMQPVSLQLCPRTQGRPEPPWLMILLVPQALRLAAAEHRDLLLTDLDLPGMTGIELLAALREVVPALPVAVTSAHALDGTLTSLLGHADEYLEKPVRLDTLIATATALTGQGRRPAQDAGLQGTDRAG